SYQWRFNDIDLPGKTNATLTFTNVQFSHEGIYTAAIADRFASVLSAPARLVILVNPEIVEPPLSQTVVAGGDVTLSARITGYPPPFGYLWRRGTLTLTNQVLMVSNSFFTLRNVQPSQGSTGLIYRMIVTNVALPQLVVNAAFTLNMLPN